MRQSALRPPLPSRSSLLSRALVLGALACGLPCAYAEDHPPAPAPAPGGTSPAAQPQPLPVRQDPALARRPRQSVEVIPVDNAEELAAKLQELIEKGLFITAVTAVTANGKPAVVVVGMPQPLPQQRPPTQPRPAPPGGPIGGAGQPQPAQAAAPPPPAAAPPPPAQAAPPPAKP
jgi:hypothetical protein